MPKITNLAGLPDPLVRAVSYSDRDVGDSDYTITELLSPPRIVALRRQHADELTEDVADRIWALMGSAAHEVLRRAATKDDTVVEKRFFTVVDGKKISGQVDFSSKTGEIFDYKFTSVWSVKDGVKPEWEAQLNCYRFLREVNGYEVIEMPSMNIVAVLRDWSKPEALRNPEYPQTGVVVMPVTDWGIFNTRQWIRERIAMHEAAKTMLPECTPEEMWERPSVWAVKKKGGSRAIMGGLCNSEAEALVMTHGNPKLEIEFRPGTRPRCESYCQCAPFCEQFKLWKAANP